MGTQQGGDGNDTLVGEPPSELNPDHLDTLLGGGGDDVLLDGSFGLDPIDPTGPLDVPYPDGKGGDLLQGGDGDDVVYATGADTLDGGAGIDTLHTSFGHDQSGSFALDAGGAPQVVPGGALISGFERIDMTGSAGDDTIVGGALNDTLSGGGGSDVLRGGGGDDLLSSAGGGLLDGGAGLDTARFDFSNHATGGNPEQLITDAYRFERVEGDAGGLRMIDHAGTVTTLHEVELVNFQSITRYSIFDVTYTTATLQRWADQEPCYARGTRILTDRGEVPVEELREGDRVRVLLGDGGFRPVRWVGHRRVALRHHPMPERARPVRFRAGSLAEGVPHRDLVVSPDHALFLGGVLVHAETLINGATVVQEEVAEVEYFHVELDAHDVMVAEGAAAE
ncbi:Hint domain-containing protein, partial [Roseomonas elaeocarpi]